MNPTEIKQIIDAVCSTDIKKFKYVNNGIKIEIDRNEASMGMMTSEASPSQMFHTHAMRAVDTTPASHLQHQVLTHEAAPEVSGQSQVKADSPVAADQADVIASPIVGVFYASPTPESPSYAAVGQLIKKGDILCIVEAMKVMNEITAEYDLKVVEVMASNEQLVEFGQPLFKVEKQ